MILLLDPKDRLELPIADDERETVEPDCVLELEIPDFVVLDCTDTDEELKAEER